MLATEIAKLLDERGLYSQADQIETNLKSTAATLYAYHYPLKKDDIKSIKSRGLLTASQMVRYPDLFKLIKSSYKDRVKAVYNGKITDEILLDYLDYSRALFDDVFQLGRNCVFALLGPMRKGISEEHDRVAEMPVAKINLTKVAKLEGVRFYMVELPAEDEDKTTKKVSLADLRWLSNVDFLSFWDEKHAEGLLFGNVPHLAIYLPAGKVPADCLEFE